MNFDPDIFFAALTSKGFRDGAITAIALMSASTSALANNAASIQDGFGCNMYDQNGTVSVFTDASHSVITHSGKNNLKCSATTANDTGKSIRFSGFLCYVNGNPTNRSWEVIDSLGNATLTCQIH